MSPPAILHVGMQKTATSTLQQNCFPRLQGIAYLGKPLAGPATALVRYVITTEGFAYDPAQARAMLSVIRAELPPGRAPMLSYEGLLPPRSAKTVDALVVARRLSELFGEARILFTLRSQYTLLVSLYVHLLLRYGHRETRYLDLDGWLDHHMRRPHTAMLSHLRYDEAVAAYAELFGRENLCLLLYEDFRRDRRDFMARFCAFAGLDEDLGWLEAPLPRANTSYYTRRFVAYQPLARLLGPFNLVERLVSPRALREFFARGRPVRLEIGAEWRTRLADYYGPGNARLAANFGIDLAAHDYPRATTAAAGDSLAA